MSKAVETPAAMLSAPIQILAMGCEDASCDFKPMRMQRRPLGDHDILIDMKYCGVCHTDLHFAANHLKVMPTKYPCVPGHELAGVVEAVGSKVTKFKVGDQAGVGCMVDSCLDCKNCKAGEEQSCNRGQISTYQGKDKFGRAATSPPGQPTVGGYTTKQVVDENFGIMIPKSYPLECAGPVMCAGVTMYDPLKKYGAGPGMKVGIVGLGGLGVMGIKIANAMGATVTAISRSEAKKKLATASGATGYISTSSVDQMIAASKSFDLILDTIPSKHELKTYVGLIATGGKLVVLGLSADLVGAIAVDMLMGGCSIVTASRIGGIRNTQEVIDLCDKAEPKIVPDIKVMPVTELNSIFQLLDGSNDAGIRYVLDLKGSLNEEAFEKCTAPPPTLGLNTTEFNIAGVLGSFCNIGCSQCDVCCCMNCLTCRLFRSKRKISKVAQAS